jgi:hypothetical protein
MVNPTFPGRVFQELENAAFSEERLEPKRIADAMKRNLGEIGLS